MSYLPDTMTIEDTCYYAHPTAEIDPEVIIGTGCKIWRFSYLQQGSVIGNNCTIGQNNCIGPNVTIGSGCKIQNNVSLFEGITLEDEVFCGPGAVFTNDTHPRAHLPKNRNFKSTLVRKGATIGANATILCGITIGEYAFIGAGCVVTKDVPAHALVIGNPGMCVGHVCICGERLNADKVCNICDAHFPELVT